MLGTSKSRAAARLLLAASATAVALAAAPPAARAQTPAAAQDREIRFRADTLVVTPVISVGLAGASRTAVAGGVAEFRTYTNYPAFIDRMEVRVHRADASPDSPPIAVAPVDQEGRATWTVPRDAPAALSFTLRAYGAGGTFDETVAHELTVVAEAAPSERKPAAEPVFGGADEAARRNIPLAGLMATATGRADRRTESVRVSGRPVPVSLDGRFAVQQIVPRDRGEMTVVVTRGDVEVARASRSFAAPRDDWFVVGQGDLTLGHGFASGAADTVSGDPTASGGFATGRAALYAKGAFGDDWRLTASLDTGEALVRDLLGNLDRKDPGQLLRRLNSERFYPTYGDDSTLVENAPTQGRFHLRISRRDSQFVVGNFVAQANGAELAQLDRGLFGALLDHRSTAITAFGERKLQVTAFASDPGTVPAREEFRGTGGSLYFLKRQDVSVGSERLRVETRDRETGLVLEARELHPQQDYDFDPLQGRLTLLSPLASTVANGHVVREGGSAGDVPVLVVRYEYTPSVGDLTGYTLGGRAAGWLGERVRVGATAQRETTEQAAQTLLGGDILLRIAAGTYAKAEVARTDGPGFGEVYSVDGGLTSALLANPGVYRGTHAYRAEVAADLAELAGRQGDRGKLSAFYESYDAGFASAGRLSPAASERWGAKAALPLGAAGGSLSAGWEELSSGAAGSSKTGTIDLVRRFGAVNAKAGLRYEDRAPGLLYNSRQDGGRADAGVEIEYAPKPANLSLHAFGQATLERSAERARNNRAGVGAKAALTERLSLASEVSVGDGGLGADVRLNRRLGEGSEAYVGYALFTDRTDDGLQPQNLFTRSNRGTLTVGARRRFGDALSVYGENRVGLGGTAPALSRSFGLGFEPTAELSISGAFENGRIDDAATGLFRRTAGSLSVGYSARGLRLGSAVEARFERGQGRDQTVWLFRNDASVQIDDAWRALARLNVADADAGSGPSTSVRAAEFTEAVAGLAYRPMDGGRLNALARVTYFEDLGPVGQLTASGSGESPKQVSTIVSVDANYDLTPRLTFGAKYGFRQGKVAPARDSDRFVTSDAHLGVVRADYTVLKAWDVLAEGRALRVATAHDTRLGALLALYRHIAGGVKLGVGYSWSDFSDDLTDQSYESHGPFLNILGTF